MLNFVNLKRQLVDKGSYAKYHQLVDKIYL
jgi:hypothetical protein